MNSIHPTTAAVGSSASGVILIIWGAKLLNVDVPPDVAVALVGLFGGIVGALMRKFSADVGIVAPEAPAIPVSLVPISPTVSPAAS